MVISFFENILCARLYTKHFITYLNTHTHYHLTQLEGETIISSIL